MARLPVIGNCVLCINGNVHPHQSHIFFFKLPWYWIALATLFCASTALRFWQLGQFDTLVFDESFFVKQGQAYLNRSYFNDVHPPLGKYLIAFGIWASKLPIWNSQGHLTAFGYRWVNALIGSFVPFIVVGIAYQLSYRRSYAFIAGLFACADGLLLVESRYALLNIYLIFFGLLAQWCLLIAISNRACLRYLYLVLAGIFFGATAAVKWYGLGFWLGIVIAIATAYIVRWRSGFQAISSSTRAFWQRFAQIEIVPLLLSLGGIPAIVYYLIWIPHLFLYQDRGFWELHQQSWKFHQELKSGSDVHPYCSPWYSWVVMARPVAYFYEKTKISPKETIIRDVHGMGNPILWWLAAIAIIILIVIVVRQLKAKNTDSATFWIPLYLLLNYGANWLPWTIVRRCSFLFYYMPASIYGFLAIAYLVDRWLFNENPRWRAIGVSIIFIILMGFAYWLPVYLGLPLSSEGFRQRMLFPSWY